MNEKAKYWLALNRISGLGPARIKRLWEYFGSAEKIWQAAAKELEKVEGMGPVVAQKVVAERTKVSLEEESAKLKGKGINILTLDDENYPERLRNIFDPPPVLYTRGDFAFNKNFNAVAIVGTRQSSPYGEEITQKLAQELGKLGVVVVSGLARGIDTMAHWGTLEAKGKTIAVLGCGIDVLYPPENEDLAGKILSSGAIISECPLGTPPEPWYFPRRNRIISGLSQGVVVVEGSVKSGAMITAAAALEQGREVFAIPGRAGSEVAQGPHVLLREGAKLVEKVEDILEELRIDYLPKAEKQRDFSGFPPRERDILKKISLEPCHIDAIAETLEVDMAEISSTLAFLELKGAIKQLPGKIYTLRN